jgi:hypothetical protein
LKDRFFATAERLARGLRANETLLCNLSAERSDFVRFNHARVRQAGSVEQAYLTLRLVRDRRQASATVMLAGGTWSTGFSKNPESLISSASTPAAR